MSKHFLVHRGSLSRACLEATVNTSLLFFSLSLSIWRLLLETVVGGSDCLFCPPLFTETFTWQYCRCGRESRPGIPQEFCPPPRRWMSCKTEALCTRYRAFICRIKALIIQHYLKWPCSCYLRKHFCGWVWAMSRKKWTLEDCALVLILESSL